MTRTVKKLSVNFEILNPGWQWHEWAELNEAYYPHTQQCREITECY